MCLPAAVFNDRPFPQSSFDHRPADKPMFTETLGLELTSLSRWPASLSVKRGAFAVTGGGKKAIGGRGGQMTSSEMFGNVMSEKKKFPQTEKCTARNNREPSVGNCRSHFKGAQLNSEVIF